MREVRDSETSPMALAAYGFVALFWLGMVCGVSFLATPVKFQATSMSLPVALEIGNVTFAAFSRVEWALAVLLMMATVFVYRRRVLLLATALLVVILAVQSFWLLPVLDARMAAVIAGSPLPASMHHFIYASGEGLKALLLLGASLCALFGLVRSHRVSGAAQG